MVEAPLAIQVLEKIIGGIVSLVTAIGVILVALQAKRTQTVVENTQQQVQATQDEVAVNTRLTKVVGREAKEAHKEAQAAVVHANQFNEKIERIAERQLQLVIPDDEEFIMLLTRCIASAREVQEQRRGRRGGG